MELQLNSAWTFYYLQKEPNVSYEDTIHKIGKFQTAEGFWQIYSHMVRPEKLPQNIAVHLFRGDSRAMWEDEDNRKGGSFLIRLQKKQANRMWERLALNLIGEQMPDDINGIAVSTRQKVDFIYVWHRTAADPNIRLEIANSIAKVLELTIKSRIDYNPFDGSSVGLDPKNLIQYIVETNGVAEKEVPKLVKQESKEQAPTA